MIGQLPNRHASIILSHRTQTIAEIDDTLTTSGANGGGADGGRWILAEPVQPDAGDDG